MTYIVIQFDASKSAPYGINQFVHPPTSLLVYSKKNISYSHILFSLKVTKFTGI